MQANANILGEIALRGSLIRSAQSYVGHLSRLGRIMLQSSGSAIRIGEALMNNRGAGFVQDHFTIHSHFSERGYQALVDVNRIGVPTRIDPDTHEIACEQKRVYRFQVMFAASAIRRGHD